MSHHDEFNPGEEPRISHVGITVYECGLCPFKTNSSLVFQNHLQAHAGTTTQQLEQIDHPTHYGGADNPYEAIKVIEAWKLGFNLGNAAKYICRAGSKPGVSEITDLEKARWYLDREIQSKKKNAIGR